MVDYDNLRAAIVENCLLANLQPLDSFIIKIIQLYEMIIVRHGLMLVGYSFGMKTSAERWGDDALRGGLKEGLQLAAVAVDIPFACSDATSIKT